MSKQDEIRKEITSKIVDASRAETFPLGESLGAMMVTLASQQRRKASEAIRESIH